MKVRLVIVLLITFASPPAFAWNSIRDVVRSLEKSVRHASKEVVRVSSVEHASAIRDLSSATASGIPEEIAAAEEEKKRIESRAAEIERQTRVRIEQQAVSFIETHMPLNQSISFPISQATVVLVADALYGLDYEPTFRTFENYVFVEIDPFKIEDVNANSMAMMEMVLYWHRQGERVELRFSPLEKRLRSATPRLSNDNAIVEPAKALVAELAASIEASITL